MMQNSLMKVKISSSNLFSFRFTSREAMFVFCSVLSLIPHIADDDLPENVSSELQFKDRPWSLGSIIEDGLLKDWIHIIMKYKKQVDYAIVKETNVKCIHQRIRKQWCLF